MTVKHAAFMGRRLIGHKATGTQVTRRHSSVTVLIAQNLLRVGRATGSLSGLMGSTAAAGGRIGCRIALLGECERGGRKRDSDCDAQSSHGDHLVSSFPTRRSNNAGARAGFPTSICKFDEQIFSVPSGERTPRLGRCRTRASRLLNDAWIRRNLASVGQATLPAATAAWRWVT